MFYMKVGRHHILAYIRPQIDSQKKKKTIVSNISLAFQIEGAMQIP